MLLEGESVKKVEKWNVGGRNRLINVEIKVTGDEELRWCRS
jgi:hypothetical protein